MSDNPTLKIAPHSIESEQGMIGSVLIDKDAFIKIVDILQPQNFYEPRHQMIYEAMMDLFYAHKPIDLVTLTSKLKDKGDLEKIGGGSYLSELAETVPTSSHIVQYANTVREKSTLRGLIRAGQDISALGYDQESEIDGTVEQAEKVLYATTQSYIKENFVHIREIVESVYDKTIEIHDNAEDGATRGLSTGFRDLDNILSGFQPADLVIVAARPSMGKTAFVLNIAQKIGLRGKSSVGLFSLEMAKEQLVERMFCSLLQIDSWKLRTGKLEDDDFNRMGDAIDQIGKANIFIDDVADASVTDIRAKARRLQMEHGLDIIIIDYLQLMKGNNPMNRVLEISEMTRGLKALARELNVPIVVLSQLSRAVESRTDKEPMLSDLRESGSIEQDADVVLMLYREKYYHPESDDSSMKLLIRKHRNGAVGTVALGFDLAKQTLYDIDQSHIIE
ncbi:MAG: replicative DNA helicase [Patescibacteria group bacterium]|nr:replicative DNA helicase [Patescibacteria group bacterium]